MCKLTVIITHKGKEYIHEFEDDRMTTDYTIRVLLSNKDSSNNYNLSRYHYICKLYNGSMAIPDTSMIPEKSAYINIKLNSDKFNGYLRRDWKLPLHAIGCQCNVFPLDGEYSIEL
jgi:hypothetical protein